MKLGNLPHQLILALPQISSRIVSIVRNCGSPREEVLKGKQMIYQGQWKVLRLGGTDDGACVSTHTLGGSGGTLPQKNFHN